MALKPGPGFAGLKAMGRSVVDLDAGHAKKSLELKLSKTDAQGHGAGLRCV